MYQLPLRPSRYHDHNQQGQAPGHLDASLRVTPAPSPSDSNRVPLWWWATALVAVIIAVYSLRYAIVGERAYISELADSFRARPLAILAHTLFGPIALILGLVNLLPAMRQRSRWSAHRLAGKVYLVAVLVLGTAGFYLALFAAGGLIGRVGFVTLAVATLATATQGYLSIRRGDVTAHRQWMLRSYALIFAAVMLRLWLPLLLVVYHGEFLPAYRWVAWVSWVPNMVWAEWMIRRGWYPSMELPGAHHPEGTLTSRESTTPAG